ncbi:TetR/AcrR family transcriptional regulator C-terminal ligand-binding domain-containing protein [Burkholderia stagnalis]
MNEPVKEEAPLPRRRPGGRSSRVRDAVISATLAQLEISGFQGLSIGTVAACSGVHESSIYRRWKTKEGLVTEAIFELFSTNIAIPDRGSLHADLVAVMSATARYLRTGIGTAAIQFFLATYNDKNVTDELHRLWTHRFSVARQMFDRAVQRGEWPRDEDPAHLLQSLLGMVYLRIFIMRDPLTLSQLRNLTRWLLRGRGA